MTRKHSAVRGIAPSRWRSAAESLAFATLVSVVIAAGATVAAALHPSPASVWPEVLAVSEGARAAGLVLLPVLSSSALVLRITHAVSQVSGVDDLRYESAERRFERTAGLCCVIATPIALAALPAAFAEPGRIASGLGLLALAGLTFAFAFAIGNTPAPDAEAQRVRLRVQFEQVRAARQVYLAAKHGAPAVAVRVLAAFALGLLVVAPLAGAASWYVVSGDSGEFLPLLWSFAVCAVMSAYGIAFCQRSRFASSATGRLWGRIGGALFASIAWVGVGVVVVTVLVPAEGPVEWLRRSFPFFMTAVVAWAALSTGSRFRYSIGGSVNAIAWWATDRRMDRLAAQIAELTTALGRSR